jgi:kynurenine formamidase
VEAEYVASSNATKEAIWLRVLLEDMGYPQTMATLIHADHQGCIALARNLVAHSRAKHIDIRHHFIRERLQISEIRLEYCSTKDMLADIFTKQLLREAFETFRLALGVVAV